MIPSLILLGLVLGRWWRLAVVAAAVSWPVLLVAADVMTVQIELVAAAGLAAANTGVGALVHHGVAWVFRRLRARHAAARTV